MLLSILVLFIALSVGTSTPNSGEIGVAVLRCFFFIFF